MVPSHNLLHDEQRSGKQQCSALHITIMLSTRNYYQKGSDCICSIKYMNGCFMRTYNISIYTRVTFAPLQQLQC
uniref:Uncharacterized protein n=1 Tax=Anguilla anguilla TaxID=7936 RepID=A0A0E9X3V0_ANGAN